MDTAPPKTWFDRWRRWFPLGGALLLAGLLATSLVFVDEAELVIVERLGTISAIYDRDEDRGLHFKVPWPLETARRVDRRVRRPRLPVWDR